MCVQHSSSSRINMLNKIYTVFILSKILDLSVPKSEIKFATRKTFPFTACKNVVLLTLSLIKFFFITLRL